MQSKFSPSESSNVIREPFEIWEFIRTHNIVRVFPYTESRGITFMTNERDILKPFNFFERLFQSIKNRRRENHEKSDDLRDRGPAWKDFYTPRIRYRAPIRIKDQEIENALDKEWKDLLDISRSWKKLEKLVELGEEEIPPDLLPLKIQPQIGANQGKLKLSKKDSDELNGEIFRVVESYLDKTGELEESLRLASENSKRHFGKWLKLAKVDILTKGTIEGRYKRRKADMIK